MSDLRREFKAEAGSTFQSIHKRPPRDGEMVEIKDQVWIYKQPPAHSAEVSKYGWQFLCLVVMDDTDEGFEYEISPGIVVSGTLVQVIEAVVKALGSDGANEAANVVFQLLTAGGWKGPHGQIPDEVRPKPVPGDVQIEWPDDLNLTEICVEDLHRVMGQLRDPGFNGWLECDVGGWTNFYNVAAAKAVSVEEHEEEPPIRPTPSQVDEEPDKPPFWD